MRNVRAVRERDSTDKQKVQGHMKVKAEIDPARENVIPHDFLIYNSLLNILESNFKNFISLE
jgi:hypothetical protein